jgi:tetrahydromethanopterin S-methyltransferase subunit G
MSATEIVMGVVLFGASTGTGIVGWHVKRIIGRLDDIERRMTLACSDRAAVEARQDAQIEAAALAASKAEDLVRESETRVTKRLDEIAAKLDRLLERGS